MITLSAILDRIHRTLAASQDIRDYCQQQFAAAPLVALGNDPKSQKELETCPGIAIYPAAESLSGSTVEYAIGLEVRLLDPRATPSQPTATGTRTIAYRWPTLLPDFLGACHAALAADLAPLGIRPKEYADTYELVLAWPVVLVTRTLKIQLPLAFTTTQTIPPP